MFAQPIYLSIATIVLFLTILLVFRKKNRIDRTLFDRTFHAGSILVFVPPVLFGNASADTRAFYTLLIVWVIITPILWRTWR